MTEIALQPAATAEALSYQPMTEEEARQAYELKKYFRWERREANRERKRLAREKRFQLSCRAAELAVRERYAQKQCISEEYKVDQRTWGAESITQEERHAAMEELREGIRMQRFAQPALRAVLSEGYGHAIDTFLDFREVMKERNEGTDQQELYCGYTEEGELIHVRSNAAIIGNLETDEIVQLRANEVIHLPTTPSSDLAMRLTLTRDKFDSLDGEPEFDESDPVASLLRLDDAIRGQRQRHDQQAYVTLSSQQVRYKPFGGQERAVLPIDMMIRDRTILQGLAKAAGLHARAEGSEDDARPMSLHVVA